MSDFDSLRDDLAKISNTFHRVSDAQNLRTDAVVGAVEEVWKDVAELRDEVHAVANRLEALTNFVVSSPAEVAAAIVNDANRGTLREVRNDD